MARAALIFRSWCGASDWPGLPAGQTTDGFQRSAAFDETWSCNLDASGYWKPVNACAGELDGASLEDISRGESYPNATKTGFSYSWEAMQGVTLQALLLSRNGYPDVWDWQNQALRRATDFLARWGGFEGDNFHRVNWFVPWLIDYHYGTSYADRAASTGRQFGFTDWLYGPGAP